MMSVTGTSGERNMTKEPHCRNPALRESFRLLVESASESLAPLNEDDLFAFLDRIEELRPSDAWIQCVQQLGADSVIAQHLGTLVGHDQSRVRIDEERVLNHLLWDCCIKRKANEDRESLFDKVYNDLESFFDSDVLLMSATAPLAGVSAPRGTWNIDDSCRLVSLEEKEAAERFAEIVPVKMEKHSQRTWFLEPAVYVEIDTQEAKIIGQTESRPRQPLYSNRISERVESVVTAMRLHKSGRFAIPFISSRCRNRMPFLGITSVGFRMGALDIFPGSFELDDEDMRQVVAMIPLVSAAQKQTKSVLPVSFRWFNKASEETDDEDKLIALAITAEAFFLKDAEGELSHRLAERVALHNGVDSISKKRLYRLSKRAYDARSKLVHGAALKPQLHSSLRNLVSQFEHELRQSLRASISQDPRTRPCDHPDRWLDLLWQVS